ncbi:MAG: hypothetical protein QM820_17510 [Minicystis sp.]
MVKEGDLKRPRELQAISYRARRAADNMARTVAVPSVAEGRLLATIFNYAAPAIPGKTDVYPPDYLVVLDPVTGEILRHGKVYPRALGITDAPEGPLPAGYPRDLGAELWTKRDRIDAISPRVWSLWAGGAALGPEDRALVAEYAALFEEAIQKPLLPYYHAAAKDFFAWIAREARGEAR